MKYGFILPNRGILGTPENTVTIAQRAEEIGYDSLFKGDHIVVPRSIGSPYPYTPTGEFPGSNTGEAQEMLAVLSFLAGQTSRDTAGYQRHHCPPSEPPGCCQGPGHP